MISDSSESIGRGNAWLFFAKPYKAHGMWFEQAGKETFVFWQHGTDKFTHQMRAGDTVLIYISGAGKEESRITAIGSLVSVRTPFIIDRQRTQRLPVFLKEDLRSSPLLWKDVAKHAGNEMLKAPAGGQGAVHPVDSNVIESVRLLSGFDIPYWNGQERQVYKKYDLWNAIRDDDSGFVVVKSYIPAAKARSKGFASSEVIESESEFLECLENGWAESDQKNVSKPKPPSEKVATKASAFEAKALPKNEGQSKDAPDDASAFHFDEAESEEEVFESDQDLADGSSRETNFNGGGTALGLADQPISNLEDKLDINTEARAFARMIASENTLPPLSFGIFGRWGSGKTFFMNQVCNEVSTICADSTINGFHSKIVQVDFNAWHYMESNVWASLVDVIFKTLDQYQVREIDATETSLFDQLTTSQEIRLDAIQDLVEKLENRSKAQSSVHEAKKIYREYGPDGHQVWCLVRAKLIDNKKDISEVADIFGFENFDMQVEDIKGLAKQIKNLREDGSWVIRVLKNKRPGYLDPTMILAIFTVCLLIVSLVFHWDLEPLLGSLATAVVAWGAFVKKCLGESVEVVQKVRALFDKAESAALADQQQDFDRAELNLEEALKTLDLAESEADKAFMIMEQKNPGAKLASFISERAGSDDYHKHLGVIATIRRDFEQLSLLMRQDDDAEKIESKNLKDYREKLNRKVKLLKDRISKSIDESQPKNEDNKDLTQRRVEEALDRLDASLEADISVERPFTRIILKIDDLDRCPPKKVSEVIQAIHLFLNFPLFIVLVCVDERWMSNSLKSEFEGLVGGESGATTSDYLEKIFQIPYWIRTIDTKSSERLALHLTRKIEVVIPEGGGVDDIVTMPSGPVVNTRNADDNPFKGERSTDHFSENTPPSDKFGSPDTSLDEDVEFAEAGDLYKPIMLSREEREFLGKVAWVAGDTPRKTRRFVNVYILIKSTMEGAKATRTLPGESYGFQALLLLVAFATRGDPVSEYFFDHLRDERMEGENGWRLRSFLTRIDPRGSDRPVSIPRKLKPTIDPLMIRIVDLILCLIDPAFCQAKEAVTAKLDRLDGMEANKTFMADLLKYEDIARRYTFINRS